LAQVAAQERQPQTQHKAVTLFLQPLHQQVVDREMVALLTVLVAMVALVVVVVA
jgi:hypothetical protein